MSKAVCLTQYTYSHLQSLQESNDSVQVNGLDVEELLKLTQESGTIWKDQCISEEKLSKYVLNIVNEDKGRNLDNGLRWSLNVNFHREDGPQISADLLAKKIAELNTMKIEGPPKPKSDIKNEDSELLAQFYSKLVKGLVNSIILGALLAISLDYPISNKLLHP